MEVLPPSSHFEMQDPFSVYESDLILAELLQQEELQSQHYRSSNSASQPSSAYSKVSYYSPNEVTIKGHEWPKSKGANYNHKSNSKYIDSDDEYSDDDHIKLDSKKKSFTSSKQAGKQATKIITEPLPKPRNHGKDKLPPSRKSMIQSYEERREFRYKHDYEEYGLVTQMIGANKLRVYCYDGIDRKALIPVKLRKVLWLRKGNIVLIRKRFGQDHKADVLIKYSPEEYHQLILAQELKTHDLCAAFPQEMILHIFSYLYFSDLENIKRVSKVWNQHIKEAWKSKQFRKNWSPVNWRLKWAVPSSQV